MSFDDNPRNRMNMSDGLRRSNWYSSSWIGIAAVAAIIVLGLGYMLQDRWIGASGTAEHAATTTDARAPATAPLTPMPSVSPATTPKQ